MPEKTDDFHLIERCKRGETSPFGQLVLNHQDRIYNLCRYMLGNVQNAEDAAQDSFLKAFRNIKNFKPDASFYTWLYRIAINTCLDYRKRPLFASLFTRSKEGEEFLIKQLSHEFSPERLYASKQASQTLQLCLAELSPKLKAAILLKEIEGLSYEEIAEVLEISMGTVKSRISRARDELRALMKKHTEQKRTPIV